MPTSIVCVSLLESDGTLEACENILKKIRAISGLPLGLQRAVESFAKAEKSANFEGYSIAEKNLFHVLGQSRTLQFSGRQARDLAASLTEEDTEFVSDQFLISRFRSFMLEYANGLSGDDLRHNRADYPLLDFMEELIQTITSMP